MVVNTTWSQPNAAGEAGGTDLTAGDTLSETVWDRVQSNLYRLGGADGNAKTGALYVGGTNFVNGGMTGAGVTVQQDTNSAEALAVKALGVVAHGMTGVSPGADTDTYFDVFRHSASGGAILRGFTTATIGARVWGFSTTDDTAHGTTASAVVEVVASKKSGAAGTDPGANANLFAVRSHGGETEFIVDREGDLFNNGSSGTSTTYDDEDDGALVEAVSLLMAPGRADGFKFRLARDLEAHKAALAAGGVITLNPDGSLSMLSYKGMLGLLIDAIRQVTHAHRQLAQRVAPLLPPVAPAAE